MKVYHKNLSPYSLNMYGLCPRKFKNYKDKVKGIKFDTIYMAGGRRVHQVISHFYKNYRIPIEECFADAWQIWERNPVPEQEKKAIRCFDNFKKYINYQLNRFQKIFYPNVIEVDVNSPDGLFHGIIDFYSRELRQIIDWKTNVKASLDDNMIKQGLIYKYVLEKKGMPVDKVSFYFLNSNRVINLPKSYNYDYILKPQKDIELDTEFKKNPSAKCKQCPYPISCFSKKKLWSEVIDRYYS